MDAFSVAELQSMLERAEFALTENLLPFWANHAVDREYGGFLTRLDRQGRLLDATEKILIMQVRLISSFAAAHAFGLRERNYLDLARRGYEFVTRYMWDEERGGFFFSVTREGRLKCRRKNTDFHGYALVGFCDYYAASGDREALTWAGRVADVLMEQAADRDMGFIEDFDGAAWHVLNAEQMKLGSQQGIKTIDMHTNILEGFTYLVRVSGETRYRAVLRRVLELICSKGIHPEYGCTITAFDADWNPVADASGRMTTSYGLNVELAWLLLDALDVLGECREPYRPVVLGLIDHALAYGFDQDRGGLAAYGPMVGSVVDAPDLPEDRLWKPWWGQAELLNALIAAVDWTQAPRYSEALKKHFEWIWNHQIDHEFGDWYQDVSWDSGKPATTDKGGEWKTSFHAGRSLMRTCAALRRWLNVRG